MQSMDGGGDEEDDYNDGNEYTEPEHLKAVLKMDICKKRTSPLARSIETLCIQFLQDPIVIGIMRKALLEKDPMCLPTKENSLKIEIQKSVDISEMKQGVKDFSLFECREPK